MGPAPGISAQRHTSQPGSPPRASTIYQTLTKGNAVDVIITRVAGTGAAGSGGDDGRATEAELNLPSGVAVAADGGFLIADTGNHVVRKILAHVITRVSRHHRRSGWGWRRRPSHRG